MRKTCTLYIVIYFCVEFRLEEKKHQKKTEIKDPKLQELQERLEAKKAGKCNQSGLCCYY